MEYAISGKKVSALKTDCLILAVDEKATLLPTDLPAETASQIRQLIKDGDFSGKKSQTLLISQPSGLPARRLSPLGLLSSCWAAPFRQ